jgi:hypothetical protein
MPGTIALDFMRPSPITEDDNNYWDALHYRVGVAVRVASDIALAAGEGKQNPDFRILGRAGREQDR